MIKKSVILITFFLAFLVQARSALAEVKTSLNSDQQTFSDYIVENFQSEININQDTSLTVLETISVNFLKEKHGIFRIIPVVYSARGKTIQASFKVLTVTNLSGQPYPYETSRFNQSIKIKIGDSNLTLIGRQVYLVKYQIGDVLLRYPEHDEVYWNVTGNEWDTVITKSSVIVYSPFAKITKVDCFAGLFGSQEKKCLSSFKDQEARFQASTVLGTNKDLTLVIGLDKNNQLVFPGPIKRSANFLADNWGYPIALFPLSVILLAWYFKGRDKRYLSENIYFKPENKTTRTVSLFARPHLPLVYSPIDQVTPAQVGTIIDEKVDLTDVVAEVIELARLGHLEIKKIDQKGLLRKRTDYLFIKKEKDESELKNYQKYLLEKLFFGQKINRLFKQVVESGNLSTTLTKVFAKAMGKNEEVFQGAILLSSLRNSFYQYLDGFKTRLYENLIKEGIFPGNPEKIRSLWLGIAILLLGLNFGPMIIFTILTFNGNPMGLFLLSVWPTILLTRGMPRRKAWGYSLFRQIQGLRYYLEKGKWRTEIQEKNLFIEEVLPLAISLGVVTKLAKDMAVLGIQPPQYFSGFSSQSFGSDWNHFNRTVSHNFVALGTVGSGYSWSGQSSWSGGSGFSSPSSSGGSSGGGHGGGGGGSW